MSYLDEAKAAMDENVVEGMPDLNYIIANAFISIAEDVRRIADATQYG